MDELLKQIQAWHEDEEHQQIIDAIEALPREDWGYELTSLLARAYNNLAVMDDAGPAALEKAIFLLKSVEEQGKNDAVWNFRLGYSFYYLDREEEALPYFIRAAELDPGDPDAPMFISRCEAAISAKNAPDDLLPIPEMYSEEDMDAVEDHISEYFGEYENVFHEIMSFDIHVDICVIPPSEERNYYTLVTMGMGAHRMNVPEELAEYKLERAELLITLPPYWKLDEISIRDEKWYWPIRLLKSIARLPGEENSWIGWGHTIALNEGDTYAEDTELCGSILIGPQNVDPDGWTCVLPDGDNVNFYHLLPLYREEMEYKLANNNSAEALLERMDNVSFVVDPARPSTIAEDELPDKNDDDSEYDASDRDDSAPSDLAISMMAYLNCEFKYFPPMLDDDPIMEAYNDALQRTPKEGFVPMLIAVDETLMDCLTMDFPAEHESADEYAFDPDAVAAYRRDMLSSPLPDGKSVLDEFIKSRKEEAEEDGFDWEEDVLGESEGGEPNDRFTGIWDYETAMTHPLILAKIPVRNPWEVFAYLPFGGWNDCPDTPELMAAAKYWFEKYGAIPAVMTHDELEFTVSTPVPEEDAVELASEQYGFCPDILDPEELSVTALADVLKQSNVWYFWWD